MKAWIKSKGALSNPVNRYAVISSDYDAGKHAPEIAVSAQADYAKKIITRNQSPDVPFSQSINPYQGCEHGCIYCFARPTHNYWDLSSGLDFETRLFYKPEAAKLLKKELSASSYKCQTIAMGTNTDPYQPLEKNKGITREILEALYEYRHPVSIVTKSMLILRDLDLLAEMAKHQLASVMVSMTTLDNHLKSILEPRAAAPSARLKAIFHLQAAGVPTGVLIAPIIPQINDHEIESLLSASAEAGADRAGYMLLRLPHDVKMLFSEWLDTHYPDRASHVMNLIRTCREGKLNETRFHKRQTGEGLFADLINQRFKVACRRYNLNQDRNKRLRTDLFKVPGEERRQMDLF